MSKFRSNGKREMPELNTSSLPDLIFTVLFFFMMVTSMRDVEVKVQVKTPTGGSEIEKLEKVKHFADKTIETQKAEIGRLKKCRKKEIEKMMLAIDKVITETKAEAYKECIEKVKAHFEHRFYSVPELDNLLKELAGEDNVD